MTKVVTRYAPSPTGPQHIGGIRTALYCYLFAKKHGGEFILRIEDTDRTRFVEGTEAYILDSMKWMGIEFTQGVHLGGPHEPYRQSDRKEVYLKHVEQLLASGNAYIAFDTPAEITEMKERLTAQGINSPQYNFMTRNSMVNSITLGEAEVKKRMDRGDDHTIRFLVPPKVDVRIDDIVRGGIVIHSSHVDDKVLIKSDGMPTYHLANVVDDHLMEVTHVIRGEEWLSSTPLHVLMYKAFGWEESMPKFAHLSLLLNPDNSKMSKRNADKFGISTFPMNWKDPESGEIWEGYKEQGYLPEAFANFLALLGWNPGDEREIMSMDELAEAFSLERVIKSGAKFDIEKLKHFNQTYLRKESPADLLHEVRKVISEKGMDDPGDDYLNQVIQMMLERVTFIPEIIETAPYLFQTPTSYDEKMTRKKWNADGMALLNAYNENIQGLKDWESVKIEADFKSFIERKEVGIGKLMAPLRLALTGMSFGPGVFDISALIGKEETINRINLALEKLVPVK